MLGNLMVIDDHGARIEPQAKRLRNLICILAWEDWSVPSRQLKGLLWEPDGRDYTSALTTLVYKVRKVLPPDRLVNEHEPHRDQRYRLVRRPGDSVDTERFASLSTLGDRARGERDYSRAADLYQEALALWRGDPEDPPLPDLPETLAMQGLCEPLLARRRLITEQHIETLLTLGRHSPVLAQQIRVHLRYDPANEHLHGLLMHCLYRDGRKGEALLAFNEAAASLDELLDAPPGPALQRLRDRIVVDDPELQWKGAQPSPPAAPLETGAEATIRGVTDYMMGGKDNYAADRDFIDQIVKETGTDSVLLPGENRDCVMRMVRFLAKRGVSQFLDIGSGLPDPFHRHVHEVARQITSETKVLYVDKDPLVGLHTTAVMADGDQVIFRQADLQDVDKILHEASAHFDLSQPVALMFMNTLQYVGDADDDLGTGPLVKTMQRYLDALPAGSYLAITHITDAGLDPRLVKYIDSRLPNAPLAQNLRSPAQIERLFCGLPLLEPGLTDVANWRPDQPFIKRQLRIIGGIAAKEQ
ncbi:SAM-dependent methyltransferase [Actinomadura fulvescens]|uniref:Bacterial transcriptional activator domain-containing protein n=1 Tax=Actinomadura fulvescens TaxID=46160 RepID=A0ABN3QZN4_9ACTN